MTTKKKGGLGKGLGALFEETTIESGTNIGRENELSLSEIEPNPDQPRKDFDELALNELANSIKREGLLQPILVRPVGKKYQIIAGE